MSKYLILFYNPCFFSSSEPESSGQNRKYMDSTCWGDKVGVLSLIGFSGDSKTPQKSKGKRRAELTDDASLNFEVGIYHCDHSNRAYTALTKKTFHTSCTTRDSTPLYCITGNSLSTYLSVIIQVSPTEGKWLKLCSTGKVLFDRSLDISPTAPFPSYIIGGGDGLAVFYCSKASSSGIQPGRIDLWNARYGVQNASKNSSIPFSVATEALSSTSSICLYKASDVYINLFCRSVGQGSGCKYELMRHNLNSLEFPELAMLDPSRLGSAGTLSSMVGRLRPSESSPTQSNKKSKRESAPSIEELSMQAQYSPDLSEREAVDMVSSVLTQHASSDDRISQTQNIFSALVRRNQGFNASILSDSIRKHLSPSASAVCLQMLSHLLYGVCTDIKITGVDEKQLEGPAYDSGILQVITWIEAILDAHFPTFILGCQDRAPNGDSGIEKGNVNIYRNSLMSLMKGLSQLQTSQDLTEAVLGLSCHADRMLRSLSRRKRQQAAATGSITGQSLENWDDTKRNSNGNSDLYQLDIIQF